MKIKLIKIAAITVPLIFTYISNGFAEKPPNQIKYGEITAEEMFLDLMRSKPLSL